MACGYSAGPSQRWSFARVSARASRRNRFRTIHYLHLVYIENQLGELPRSRSHDAARNHFPISVLNPTCARSAIPLTFLHQTRIGSGDPARWLATGLRSRTVWWFEAWGTGGECARPVRLRADCFGGRAVAWAPQPLVGHVPVRHRDCGDLRSACDACRSAAISDESGSTR